MSLPVASSKLSALEAEHTQQWLKQQNPMLSFPAKLVFPASDLIREFEEAIGPEIVQRDIEDIVSHVVMSLLFDNNPDDIEHMPLLPDFNRMRSTVFFKEPARKFTVERAAAGLSAQLFQRMQEYKAFHNGEFPYFFVQFVGKDLYLELLPH